MNLEIVDSKLHHCGKMARNIRSEQKGIYDHYGVSVHNILCHQFRQSIICKTAILDGKVSCMGGAFSDFLSDTAYVWFAISDDSNSIRFSVIKELMKNINKIFETKNKVISLTDVNDKIALRMARFLGFEISQEMRHNYGNRIMMEINKESFRR